MRAGPSSTSTSTGSATSNSSPQTFGPPQDLIGHVDRNRCNRCISLRLPVCVVRPRRQACEGCVHAKAKCSLVPSADNPKPKTIVAVGKSNVKKRKRKEPVEYLEISSDSEDLNDHEKNLKITRVGPPKGKRKAVDTNESSHDQGRDQHLGGNSSLRAKREGASPTIKSQSTSTQDGQRTRVSEDEHRDSTMSYIRRDERGKYSRVGQLERMPSLPSSQKRPAMTGPTDAAANAGTHVRERETNETRRSEEGHPPAPLPMNTTPQQGRASTRSPLEASQANSPLHAIARAQQRPCSRSPVTVFIAAPASTTSTALPTTAPTSATPLQNPPPVGFALGSAPASIPIPIPTPAPTPTLTPAHDASLPTTLPALRTHLTRLKTQLTEQESVLARKREEISRLRREADREEEVMWEMRREVADCGLRMVRMEREEREREREGAGMSLF